MRAFFPLALLSAACSSHAPAPARGVGTPQDASQTGAEAGDEHPSDAAFSPGPSDAAALADAALRDASADQPLTTPLDTWTFLPIDGAKCGNGTPTGIGVNRSTQSRDLVIMLEGGG